MSKTAIFLTGLTGLIGLAGLAPAQAFCALRDPNQAIFELYPEADSYQSIVRTISGETRRGIDERLPFNLHFNELGRHTLYVALDEGVPLGVVHSRSEATRWGLAEINWALDLNLRVRGFSFQRCRDGSKTDLERQEVQTYLRGADYEALRKLLDRDGTNLQQDSLPISESSRRLGAALIRNGLKTILTTQLAWPDDLWNMRATVRASAALPTFSKLAELEEVYGHQQRATLEEALGSEEVNIDREHVRAWDLLSSKGVWLGRQVMTPWSYDEERIELWWLADTEGNITSVDPDTPWPLAEMQEAFQAQIGEPTHSGHECATAARLAAMEVLVILSKPKLELPGH